MSVKVEYSVVVERPVADVWAFMDDLDNYPEWVSGLDKAYQLTAGPKQVGTRMAAVYIFLGRRGIAPACSQPSTAKRPSRATRTLAGARAQ